MLENMLSYHIVIPARYASTRFPGKPLQDINGKTMLEHVYLVAQKSTASSIVIATDDQRIKQVAETFCEQVIMTSGQHQSGTDRLAEVCLTPPELLYQVANNLHENEQAAIATLTTPLTQASEIDDPNIVKVVSDINGFALYFSRATIPYQRDVSVSANINYYQRHLGIYAYRVGFLNAYTHMPQSEIEIIEKLEQLRALYHGYKIHTQQAEKLPGPGIDTPEDLDKLNSLMAL